MKPAFETPNDLAWPVTPADCAVPVRLRALYDGKRLYMPVPEFSTGGLPWLLFDPHRLEAAGI